MSDFHFAVYEHILIYDGDKKIKRQLIVLKDSADNIIGWTDFHKFAQSPSARIKSIYSDSGKRCYSIAKFLNYIFWDCYHITKLSDLTAQMVCDFLNDYGLCRLPGDNKNTIRNKTTVTICVAAIIDFLTLLLKKEHGFRMKVDDLYHYEKFFDKRTKREKSRRVPNFTIYFSDGIRQNMLRDLPEGAFQILFNEIAENHRNILMLAALSAFGGLRPSEACNVRREDSPLGPGMRFQYTNGKVSDVIIDLREEKILRSDLIDVGGIKKPREQRIYPKFLGQFMDCYTLYSSYIVGHPYEADYGALTNTRSGKAMTYKSYLNAFQKAVQGAIPKMLACDDPKVQHYGFLLQEHSISPHIFRHWFSVHLTIDGATIADLMYWRGDKSPESSLTYLQNKSELVKQYYNVSNKIMDYNLWRADKKFGDNHD